MKRKIYTLATVLLIAMLAITPVYAGGISGNWGLGSITFDGTAWGFGKDAVVKIYASGRPLVACGAPGNYNPAQGQNLPSVIAEDSQSFAGSEPDKGKFDVSLAAEADFTDILNMAPTELGCANDNWNIVVFFVEWEDVTITAINAKDDTRYTQHYSCTTTYTGIDYNNTPDSTLDDGTITCTPS